MPSFSVLDAEPVGESVVKLLENIMLRAQKGELSSVAIAVVERDGTADWDWSQAPNTSTLIGSVERMKADLIRSADAD